MALSRNLQFQALADLLAGLPVDFRPSDFTGICRLCWEAALSIPPAQPDLLEAQAQAIYQATFNHPLRYEFLTQLERIRPGAPWPVVLSLQEQSAAQAEVQWLWPGWLPRGFISILGSESGAGKSLVALDLCRRLLAQLPWPDAAPPFIDSSSRIVYVEAEAAVPILVQRARLWHMDLGRLYAFVPPTGDPIDLSLPGQREQLGELCTLTRPHLIVVDSLSFATSQGLLGVHAARDLLNYLGALALELQSALLVIHHLHKPDGKPRLTTIHDFFGSFFIIALSRSVLGLSLTSSRRRLEVLKSNLSALPPPLELHLHCSSLNISAGSSISTVPAGSAGLSKSASLRLDWSPWIDAEPTHPAPFPPPPTLRTACKSWLLDLLRSSSTPLKTSDIISLGQSQGFNRRLIFRARRDLSSLILNTHGRQHPSNAWFLPGKIKNSDSPGEE